VDGSTDRAGSPDIILVWPSGREAPPAEPVPGYSVRALPRELDSWWVDIHRQATPWFEAADLERWLDRYRELALENGVLVATADATGEPAATSGSLANAKDGMFPDGGQLGWVATVPRHRGRGLATWLSALATRRLLDAGFRRVFLCTGDDMPAAIGVYLRLGYVPCLHAPDQRDRWARICDVVGVPFDPERWPTHEEYLRGR
jgi:mycothiol synthase